MKARRTGFVVYGPFAWALSVLILAGATALLAMLAGLDRTPANYIVALVVIVYMALCAATA